MRKKKEPASGGWADLIRTAQSEGPQVIKLRGKREAVLLSQADYRMLRDRASRFLALVRNSPLGQLELVLARDKSAAR